jgi:RimJ/RimL family protein N-acetyltransferase
MNKKVNASEISLISCLPQKDAARIAFEWRNDEISRKMSYNSFHISWSAFWKTFISTYFNIKEFSPLFITYKNQKVGFLRFELFKNPYTTKECTSIMLIINMSPDFRGRGIGSIALKKCINHLLKNGADTIFADVKQENLPSRKAFTNAGFKICDKRSSPTNLLGENIKILRFVWEE